MMSVAGSGRCHGPNCREKASATEFFCSEAHARAWDREFHVEHGGTGPMDVPPRTGTVEPHPTQADLDAALALDAALQAAQPELERHLAAVIQAADPPPSVPTFTVAEVARIAASLPLPPEPVKLTRAQMDRLIEARVRGTPPPHDLIPGTVGDPSAVPIELVETVEESTPYQMAQVPSRVIVHRCGSPESVEELQRQLQESALNVGSRWLVPTSASTEFKQVAPVDPQVGVVRRAFRRLGWSK